MSTASSSVSPQPRSRLAEPAIVTRAVRIDPESGMAIWELRDPLTGRLLRQYPSARSVDAYRRRLAADATQA
jgi:hypothetical protein